MRTTLACATRHVLYRMTYGSHDKQLRQKGDAEAVSGAKIESGLLSGEKAGSGQAAQLNRAASVEELKLPPGNRLHRLGGDQQGRWTISINEQYRICFSFDEKARDAYEIVGGKRAVSADMALRLARWSGMKPALWLGLQADHDLATVERKRGEEIADQVRSLFAAG